jgi:hypothetical protein
LQSTVTYPYIYIFYRTLISNSNHNINNKRETGRDNTRYDGGRLKRTYVSGTHNHQLSNYAESLKWKVLTTSNLWSLTPSNGQPSANSKKSRIKEDHRSHSQIINNLTQIRILQSIFLIRLERNEGFSSFVETSRLTTSMEE